MRWMFRQAEPSRKMLNGSHFPVAEYHIDWYFSNTVDVPDVAFGNPLAKTIINCFCSAFAPRMKRHCLQLVRIFITDIIVGLSPCRLVALLGLYHID